MDEQLGSVIMLWGANLILAVALGVTTRSAMAGGLDVNGLAGIRTKETTRSPAAWVAGHRAAWPLVRWLLFGTGVLSVASAVLIAVGYPSLAFGVAFAPIVLVLIAAIPLVWIANQAARRA